MIRRTMAVLLMLAASLSFISSASAGGWAFVKIDAPLTNATVGETKSIGFMVLLHGATPVNAGTPVLTAIQAETGTTITANGVAEGAEGHYIASLVFSEPGRWKLHVEPKPFPSQTSLPTVTVLAKGAQPASTDSGATVAAGKAQTISIANFAFAPARLEISAGTTVTWVNNDPTLHEVAFIETSVDDAGAIDSGGSFSYTFEEPGTYTFYCGPHPGMTGTIVVS